MIINLKVFYALKKGLFIFQNIGYSLGFRKDYGNKLIPVSNLQPFGFD